MKIKVGSNRSFGFVFSIVFLLIALWPLLSNSEIRVWSLIISAIFLILGFLNSMLLNPLNILWFKFGLFLGKIISPLVMGFIFFCVVTPIGILMKIFMKDLLKLKYNNENSYWVDKNGPKSKMSDQF